MITLPLVYAFAAQPTPAHPASEIYKAQQDVVGEMSKLFPTVEARLVWQPCDEENGWYDPRTHEITLCTEMEIDRDAAVGLAAHEFSHAIEDQLLGLTTEQDADELSALLMVQLGHPSASVAFGQWLRSGDDGMHQLGDPHPGTAFREWELSCIVSGGLGEGPASCKSLYDGLKLRFDQRLTQDKFEVPDDSEPDLSDLLKLLQP